MDEEADERIDGDVGTLGGDEGGNARCIIAAFFVTMAPRDLLADVDGRVNW